MTTAHLTAAPLVLKLTDPATRADPYPTYARLRATAPLVQGRAPLMGRFWAVTRYADVVAVLKDPRFSSDMRAYLAYEETHVCPLLTRFAGWPVGVSIPSSGPPCGMLYSSEQVLTEIRHDPNCHPR